MSRSTVYWDCCSSSPPSSTSRAATAAALGPFFWGDGPSASSGPASPACSSESVPFSISFRTAERTTVLIPSKCVTFPDDVRKAALNSISRKHDPSCSTVRKLRTLRSVAMTTPTCSQNLPPETTTPSCSSSEENSKFLCSSLFSSSGGPLSSSTAMTSSQRDLRRFCFSPAARGGVVATTPAPAPSLLPPALPPGTGRGEGPSPERRFAGVLREGKGKLFLVAAALVEDGGPWPWAPPPPRKEAWRGTSPGLGKAPPGVGQGKFFLAEAALLFPFGGRLELGDSCWPCRPLPSSRRRVYR
mmetsp:Transcript_43292/g.74749  ORF Transcript_43292/g.74749 Transcript_43292/m.74749 type:complete len:301 (-) Transcript_43292:76-978(-)